MSLPKLKPPHRTPQPPTPTYRLTDDQLAPLLAALPPLLPHAPPDWHRSRRKQIIREIAWLRPADALQAHLAGQIVVLRRLADSQLRWACVHTNSPEQARRLGRFAAALIDAGDRLECELRRSQKNPRPPNHARTPERAAPPDKNAARSGRPPHPDAAAAAPTPPAPPPRATPPATRTRRARRTPTPTAGAAA